jgi:hypothetical protein
MFGFFKPPRFTDPQCGPLAWSRGFWRGQITGPDGQRVPLALAGTRSGPDRNALQAARDLPSQWSAWRAAIEAALFEHYGPYAQAVQAGDLAPAAGDAWPRLATAAQVGPHATLVFVSAAPLDGMLTTELGYTVAWDEEHTLGIRFREGRFMALCGSVLAP